MTIDRRRLLTAAAQGLAALPLASAFAVGQSHKRTAAIPDTPWKPSAVHLNVRDFGATGDGKTPDTAALQQALDRCGALGGGEVLVPAGEYLTGAIALRSHTTMRLAEGATLHGSPDVKDYPLTQVRWEGKWIKGYLGLVSATDAENVTLTGTGRIVASSAIRGRVNAKTQWRHPALIEFVNCRNIEVEHVDTEGNDMWSIHPVYCDRIAFRNATVKGGADGIDVDSCRHVVIDGCTFDTADDCISLKSGRGMEGNTIGRPTEDVQISNCTFLDHHWACIGIGSETSAGVRNVRVKHCTCLGARTFAIYIKTRVGRGAFIEDISMEDLDVSGAQAGFLRLNFLDSGKQDEVPVPGTDGIPTVRNFQFRNIRVKGMPLLVDAMNIHPDKPLDGLLLDNITGTCERGMQFSNIRHAELRNIHVTGYTGPLLSTHNVTGTGLQGAVAIDPAKAVEPIAVPAAPYILG